jgi:hypothetical protein
MPKKLPRWRREQSQRKKIKKIRIVRLILFVILLILLGGLGFKIYRSIAKSVWDGQSQLNLAINPSIADQPVLIAAFNPEEKSLNVLLIPPRTFIETIHGYGPYRVESIYRLGELNKKGGELFQGSLQTYLGIPVDAYASMSNVKCQSPLRGIPSEWSNVKIKTCILENIRFLIKGGETNLTKWDLLRLWLGFRNLRQDKINLVDLGQTSASQEVDLLDGTKANKIDTERLELIMSQFFVDKKLKQEDLTVAVLNGTNHAGLANKVATLIKNIGGQVMTVGDTENGQGESLRQCQIKSEKKYKNSYTVRKLSHVFDCQWEGEPMAEQRANLVLIVGKSYWEKLVLP